ncbi:archease [Actibacterium sp. MT2.3-13A]|uniref:archease n=1 Tax=Actibacterium sp. MT2.3-13A TaxID=2828332 RepID=UPI001BAE318B|nr:archease [Actibacterium sp. MT2.3-13A]
MSGDGNPADWTHFPHEGDVGVRGFGRDMAEAFENTARAMTAVVVPLDLIRRERVIPVTCRAADPAILLLDWLNAVIYIMATEKMLFCDFRVRIDGETLEGEMEGENVVPERHEPSVELKGATLTELAVYRQADGRWFAQCVVDV